MFGSFCFRTFRVTGDSTTISDPRHVNEVCAACLAAHCKANLRGTGQLFVRCPAEGCGRSLQTLELKEVRDLGLSCPSSLLAVLQSLLANRFSLSQMLASDTFPPHVRLRPQTHKPLVCVDLRRLRRLVSPCVALRWQVLDASDYGALVAELARAEAAVSLDDCYAEGLQLKLCPKCHVRIEKNEGCSAMVCYRCGERFLWGQAKLVPKPKPKPNPGAPKPKALSIHVGSHVQAKWRNGAHWHNGRVEAINSGPDGAAQSYAVHFNDGTFQADVAPRDLRMFKHKGGRSMLRSVTDRLGLTTAESDYEVGAEVYAQWRGRAWFAGTVRVVHTDASCDVDFDDGDFEARVPPARLRPSSMGKP